MRKKIDTTLSSKSNKSRSTWILTQHMLGYLKERMKIKKISSRIFDIPFYV